LALGLQVPGELPAEFGALGGALLVVENLARGVVDEPGIEVEEFEQSVGGGFHGFYSRGVAASSFLFCVGLAESEGFEEG
jgi:hypothetical protein